VTSISWVAGTVACIADGTSRQTLIIDIDNAAPVTSLAITQYSDDGGITWNPRSTAAPTM
jgi:hypothetical protein